MTTKRRVHQVAKEFNISNEALIEFLTELDFAVQSPNAALTDEMYEQIVKKYRKEPAKKDADYEFRRQIRDKKLEEEKERAKARQELEERMRVATRLMEKRSAKETTAEKRAAQPAPEEAKPARRKAAAEPQPPAAPPVEVVATAPPVSETRPESKPVPSLQETIAALIPEEDLHPAAAPAHAEPPSAQVTVVEPVAPPPKKGTAVAEAVEEMTEASKKRKKRRRRKKKDKAAAPESEDVLLSEVEPPREKVRHPAIIQEEEERTARKSKRKKKRKISEAEIEESIRQTLAAMEGAGKPRVRRRRTRSEEGELAVEEQNKLQVPEFISVADLAKLMEVDPGEVIRKCMALGLIVSINQRLDADTIVTVADEFGYDVEIVQEYGAEVVEEQEEPDDPADLVSRPPVVTIMGHVDHGKTSLLDYIRASNIVARESGGITQHIGAYEVEFNGRLITFLDTPGHEAFTAMRARGAKVTDVVVLVVAADDGVQQQTLEAISHARAAGVPIVIAINKIDKPTANPDVIKNQLSQHGILVESWGGKYQSAEISAKTGVGVDHLLELVLLEADILDLKANPKRRARGVVIEAELDKGKGPVATVLVQNGTLKVGDPFIAGHYHGKVRAMYDEHGRRLQQAPPSKPVRVVGFAGIPSAGDTLVVMRSEAEAREISLKRQQLKRAQEYRKAQHLTLDQLSKKIKEGGVKELRAIVKADFDGSVEALSDALLKLSTNEVAVNVIHKGVGGISESDVLLAAASDAVIFGFHVRATQQAREIAERESVDIRIYKIIYDAVNDVKAALEGMLEPEISEEITSSIVVREIFRVPKVGTVAGCYVQSGKVHRSDSLKLYRNDKLIFEGKIASLKRFKDDVREVAAGFECGLKLEGYDDLHVGDVMESFQIVKTKRTLVAAA
ncbi:MAG: translation initiation factor IF-2 [candidate division KSB1 bacterium]|nr:translation initiation factor IF-2 [candidate division KSB1 bacterium]MDZ7275483.1 translation initiation factor IF-2 [candidate division KSB1 bacterium]MDZ7286205.1 translation initiation factor IF-2 [candidate division KSB1 bacterium]MDZ7296431.1 translation initiation factor IF-2 [candidate division KSB1 bacterium]MDZ7309276.1 translation initiation factor IF-2 [candidate division KSB1 bacterium]